MKIVNSGFADVAKTVGYNLYLSHIDDMEELKTAS